MTQVFKIDTGGGVKVYSNKCAVVALCGAHLCVNGNRSYFMQCLTLQYFISIQKHGHIEQTCLWRGRAGNLCKSPPALCVAEQFYIANEQLEQGSWN